jgi:hypothetical protein
MTYAQVKGEISNEQLSSPYFSAYFHICTFVSVWHMQIYKK